MKLRASNKLYLFKVAKLVLKVRPPRPSEAMVHVDHIRFCNQLTSKASNMFLVPLSVYS